MLNITIIDVMYVCMFKISFSITQTRNLHELFYDVVHTKSPLYFFSKYPKYDANLTFYEVNQLYGT